MPRENSIPVKNACEESRNASHPRYEALRMRTHLSEVIDAFGSYASYRRVGLLAQNATGYILVVGQTENLRDERVDASTFVESVEVLQKLSLLTELPERAHIAHEGLFFSSTKLLTEDVVAHPHF